MKKMLLACFGAACLALFGCGGESATGAPALGECCTKSMKLVHEMPACCQKGIGKAGELSGCCATGMADGTADADRPECCKQSRDLLAKFSDCCRNTVLTGKADGCCAAMPAALAANAAQ